MTISWLTYWTWTILKEWANNNLQVVHMCDNSISHHLPVRSKKEISRRQPQVDPAGCYFWEISTLLWLEILWKTSPVENGGLSAPMIYGVSTVQAGAKFRNHPQCGPGKQWLWAMQTEDVSLVGDFNPSEKYESQLGWLSLICGKSKNSCSKPPSSSGFPMPWGQISGSSTPDRQQPWAPGGYANAQGRRIVSWSLLSSGETNMAVGNQSTLKHPNMDPQYEQILY